MRARVCGRTGGRAAPVPCLAFPRQQYSIPCLGCEFVAGLGAGLVCGKAARPENWHIGLNPANCSVPTGPARPALPPRGGFASPEVPLGRVHSRGAGGGASDEIPKLALMFMKRGSRNRVPGGAFQTGRAGPPGVPEFFWDPGRCFYAPQCPGKVRRW